MSRVKFFLAKQPHVQSMRTPEEFQFVNRHFFLLVPPLMLVLHSIHTKGPSLTFESHYMSISNISIIRKRSKLVTVGLGLLPTQCHCQQPPTEFSIGSRYLELLALGVLNERATMDHKQLVACLKQALYQLVN